MKRTDTKVMLFCYSFLSILILFKVVTGSDANAARNRLLQLRREAKARYGVCSYEEVLQKLNAATDLKNDCDRAKDELQKDENECKAQLHQHQLEKNECVAQFHQLQMDQNLLVDHNLHLVEENARLEHQLANRNHQLHELQIQHEQDVTHIEDLRVLLEESERELNEFNKRHP